MEVGETFTSSFHWVLPNETFSLFMDNIGVHGTDDAKAKIQTSHLKATILK